MKSFALAVAATAVFALAGTVQAKDPLFTQCQSIRMIVPYTAGGGGDVGEIGRAHV